MPGTYPTPDHHAGPPMVNTTIIDPLDGLAQRVAHGDRSALSGLHDALAPDVLRTIRRRLPDAAKSMSVLRATFVEVWWLARFHTCDGTVRAWVTGVADRRAAELVRGSSDRVDWSDVIAIHDAHTDREFDRLLGVPEGKNTLSASYRP